MKRRTKPNRVGDIQARGSSVFRASPTRLNLSYKPVRRIPITATLRIIVACVASWFLVLGSVSAPTTQQTFAANTTPAEDRTVLEQQLKDLESQIDQYEGQISGYQKQGSSLKNEISTLNSKIAKINLQIKAVNVQMSQLDTKISDTEVQIDSTEKDIQERRGTLTALLNELYQNNQENLLHVFLKNPKLSDFFSDVNNITLLQSNVRLNIREIGTLKDQLEDQKEQFALARADAATLRDYQAAQKQQTDSIKGQKDQLLAVTKGQESKYKDLLQQTKQTAAQIRSRIFELLGGGELTFDQAYQYAKLAEGATGVRAALILAVLDRESALGKNVGRCSYLTAMSPKNQTIFLDIVKDLGVNPDTMQVSCPNKDGVYGGAMGPAQFIPSTWLLYREKVGKVTGHVASPWNNADAFVATALYMADAGAANAASVAVERKAAARYYAGGNWARFLWTYGEAVVSRAAQFQEDIDTIGA